MNCENCIHYCICSYDGTETSANYCSFYEEDRPHDGWIKCSDRLPTADDGERVIVHYCFEKPVCEYVFVPWKTVEFEYKVGHIDAWLPIPTYKETE